MRGRTLKWRRLALAVGSLATAGSLVGGASFALFTSAAAPQAGTFAAGTVVIGRLTPPEACVIADIEPTDGPGCKYQNRYTGSLNAWVGLLVTASSVATEAWGRQPTAASAD